MTDHKEIFLKYGFVPPKELYIPTEEEIEENLKNYVFYNDPVKDFVLKQTSSFHLSLNRYNGFLTIGDHNHLIASLNLNVDLSKIHPDILYFLRIYLRAINENPSFGIQFYDFFYELSATKTDMYLTRFSPGYPLRKTFFNDAKNKTIELLEEYLETTLSDAFENADPSKFLAEIYEYICQEQEKRRLRTINIMRLIKKNIY